MLEAVAINLCASALSSAGGIGIDNVRDILRRDRFSQDVDDLTTEFTEALEDALSEVVSDPDHAALQGVEANWTTIAEELDALDVIFEDEQEAVVRVADAVGAGLDIDLDSNPALRETLEAAVADAYRTALRNFADRVAGTDLADVFDTETNIEVTATVNALDDRLAALQRRLRRYETAALRNVGITRLDPLYFERQEPGDPRAAWRTGFSFADVQAGYPLERQRPARTEDATRQELTDEIVDHLDAGENLVVLGDGGSGKSTVCKRVACRWHGDTDRGPVFYRQSSATATFDQPGEIEAAIRAAEERVLVVVEDAASGDATAVFDALDAFATAGDVSFLLDSRESAWRDSDELAGAPAFKRQRQRLGVVEMPALDELECGRTLEHYEQVTGETVGRTGERLYEEVRTADIGGPLVLAYELTGPPTRTGDGQAVTALHDDVHRAYLRIRDHAEGAELPQVVAVMVNVLNAAQLPVEEALVHTLATDRDGHRTIDRTLSVIEGKMLETSDSGMETPHPVWSVLYLERVLEHAGERVARDYFEQCVDALFRLCDEAERRAEVAGWLRETPEVFEKIDENPTGQAGRFVRRLADIGEDRATLGVLYGTPATWRVRLPESCPTPAELQWYNSRGQIHLQRGRLDAAQAEFEHLEALIKEATFESASDIQQWRATSLNNLGLVAGKRGELDAAEEYFEKSLAIKREVGDRHGQAGSLGNLGLVARRRGELNAAEEYVA